MPRTRMPIDVRKGNITQLAKERKKIEEKSVVAGKSQLLKAPSWLIDKVARDEWKRLVKELSDIDLIGNLDLNNLGAYCNAFSCYLQVTNKIKELGLFVEIDGLVGVHKGLIDTQKRYTDEMKKFGSMCGLTIDSRLKAAKEKVDKMEDNIKEKFGI